MNAHTSYAIIAILAVVGTASLTPAFGGYNELACPDCVGDSRAQAAKAASEEVPITMKTDKTTYDHKSMILIEGKVANVRAATPVTVIVTSPLNSIVTIQQIDVNANGEFAASLNTAGNLWKYDGKYTIKAQYGSQAVFDKTTIQLIDGMVHVPTTPKATCSTSEIAASDQCVPYSITGGSVTSADINDRDNSILVRINANNDGEIVLNPSKKTIGGIFMVLVDGQQWDDATIDGNKVTVMFPAGTEEIEIIGTFVIPEFGTIASLVLAVAIVSIIAVTARSKLSVMPKF